VDSIVAQGYSEEFGVRHLRRTVQTLVEAPLSRLILSGELKAWPGVELAVANGQLVLQPRVEKALDEVVPVCCECGCAIAPGDRDKCAWIGDMFICARCKAKVEELAIPPTPRGQP